MNPIISPNIIPGRPPIWTPPKQKVIRDDIRLKPFMGNPNLMYPSTAGGSWDPLSSSMTNAYMFDDLSKLWQNTARTTAVTAIGQNIQAIDDLIGTDHLIRNAGTGQCTYEDDGDGAVNWLHTASSRMSASVTSHTGAMEWVLVWKRFDDGDYNRVAYQWNGIDIQAANADMTIKRHQTGATITNGNLSENTVGYYHLVFDGSSSEVFKDGSSIWTGDTGNTGINSITIGSNASNHECRIYELLVNMSGTLMDTDERADMNTYIQDKWGL